MLWRLWKNRNELLFRSKDYEAQTTVEKVWEDVKEWNKRDEAKIPVAKPPIIEEPVKRWTAPPPLWTKCNSDGSWNKDTEEGGGAGWILRDHHRSLLWAGAKKLNGLGSALEAEAEALRWAIYSMRGFAYRNVIFETDSLVLKRLITGEEELWPRMRPIIQEIQSLLEGDRGFQVGFYPRSSNKVADRIAKETVTFTSIVHKLYSIRPVG